MAANYPPVSAPATKSIWTASDEATLMELIARKDRIRNEGLDLIRAAMGDLDFDIDSTDFESLIKYMAHSAEALRDALAVFDTRRSR